MLKTAAARKTVMTDSQGRKFEFGGKNLEVGFEKNKDRWQGFLKVDAAAQEFIEKASKSNDPANAEDYIKQGLVYGQQGKHKEALSAFKEAIRLDPNNPLGQSLVGTAYSSLGQFEAAIPYYKKAISLKPDFYSPYFNLGSVYNHLNRNQEAVEAYKQAIKLKPDDVDSHYNLGVTYSDLGNREAALKEYNILNSLDKEAAKQL